MRRSQFLLPVVPSFFLSFIGVAPWCDGVLSHVFDIREVPRSLNGNVIFSGSRLHFEVVNTGFLTVRRRTTHCYPPQKTLLKRRCFALEMALDPWRRRESTGGDMAYVRENIDRQAGFYNMIRSTGGVDVVNDVYVRNPRLSTFFYVGKVARCTGTVTLELAVSRQWNLIEEHAARLRPVELGRSFGSLEIWCAAGDSELDMAENSSAVELTKMEPVVPEMNFVNLNEIGFKAEVVTNRGKGFMVERPELKN